MSELEALLTIIINDGIHDNDMKYVYKYTLVWDKETQLYVLRVWYNSKRVKCGCLSYTINKYQMRAIKSHK